MQRRKWGVTPTGFKKPTITEISDDIKERMIRLFGDDQNVDGPEGYLSLSRDFSALNQADMYEILNDIIVQMDIDTQTGYFLDVHGKTNGVTRRQGTLATGHVTFYRNTPIPENMTAVIGVRTVLSTEDAVPQTYVTTQSGSFVPSLVEMVEVVRRTNTITTKNVIGNIQNIQVVPDTVTVTSFSDRQIFLSEEVDPQTIILTYAPLSVRIPVTSVDYGSQGNVGIGKINTLISSRPFVDRVQNEEPLTNGMDTEDDSDYRYRIKNGNAMSGNATYDAMMSKLLNLPGVLNVTIDDPYREAKEYSEQLVDQAWVTLPDEIVEVVYVEGDVSGEITEYTYDKLTGVLDFEEEFNETITVHYNAHIHGKFKVYIQGGTEGTIDTPNTIFYTIHHTRPLGIQAQGYGDENAIVSPQDNFTAFYRPIPQDVAIELTITLPESYESFPDSITELKTKIEYAIIGYLKTIAMGGSIFKGQLIASIIQVSPEDILSAKVDSWAIDDVQESIGKEEIQLDVRALVGETYLTINVAFT